MFLGSRSGNRPYCDRDADSDYGSGVDDRDFARYNIVMQNQIYKRTVSDMIRCNWYPPNNYTYFYRQGRYSYDAKGPFCGVNAPNYIDYNETVTEETVVNNRLAGCFVSDGYETDFIEHGQRVDLYEGPAGDPVCGDAMTCNDGQLVSNSPPTSSCDIDRIPFSCQVTGNNSGCNSQAFCPLGKTIVAATAACNLEFGTVPTSAVSSLAANTIEVVRKSDYTPHGSCYVGGTSLRSGEKEIDWSAFGGSSIAVGCKEHDKNGGDCHIRGELYCYSTVDPGVPQELTPMLPMVMFSDSPGMPGRSPTNPTVPLYPSNYLEAPASSDSQNGSTVGQNFFQPLSTFRIAR